MNLDPTILGQTAAELMERLEREHPEGELVEVLVCAAVADGDVTFYTYRSSEKMFHRQQGLLVAVQMAMSNDDERGDYSGESDEPDQDRQ